MAATFFFFAVPSNAAAQINLGSASAFTLFTATGAVGNTGISTISGNVGTQNGDITGFEPPTFVAGVIYNANVVTAQCSADLTAACIQLDDMPVTSSAHSAVFGNGETLFAGVYTLAEAGSVVGTLILDAQHNPDAVFVFRIEGAFSTAALASIQLINQASAVNVYWKAIGAVAMAAGTNMKGTVIANDGAISMAAGGTLEGRMFSTTGAVAVDNVQAMLPANIILPATRIDFSAKLSDRSIVLQWVHNNEQALSAYEIQRSPDGKSFASLCNIPVSLLSSSKKGEWIDRETLPGTVFYRLKMIHADASYRYSAVVSVKTDQRNTLSVYPNPSTDRNVQLRISGQERGDYMLTISGVDGRQLTHQKLTHTGADGIHTINLPPGPGNTVYYLTIKGPKAYFETIRIISGAE